MKIRFTRQYTVTECGPIAILNVLKYFGGPGWSYKKHIGLIKLFCEYEYDADGFQGIQERTLKPALNHFLPDMLKMRWYKIEDLEVLKKHVKKGGCFIILHRTGYNDFHYSTIFPHVCGNFLWVNYTKEHTEFVLTPEEFQSKILSRSFFGDITRALLISKA